jgi:isoaspartyl peptidase/L-asparaginase-like protein (Ntn-hydrolase superfamily)
VCFVRRILHPVTLARLVMERTGHVMLAGDGAERFAASQGIAPADLASDASRNAYEKWLAEHPGQGRPTAAPRANVEETGLSPEDSHDTVGVLALDAAGVLAGACSTSGLAFKLPGRVGDSPVIGHGLYVDPRHGAAVATGHGELIMGVCGAFLAVEEMRRGASPAEAAAEVMRRIAESRTLDAGCQAAVITLAPDGRWSSAALRAGFKAAVRTPDRDDLIDSEQVLLA